jgi:magnesium-transporting ATPase (P-type)
MRVDCEFGGGARQLVKGAPEAVATLVQAPLPAELAEAIADAAGRGERVLLVADGPADANPQYVGLLRLHDPPRPEVPAAIAACRRAGVRVLMLTGDHPGTARAIAARIGLSGDHASVLEGAALDALDDRELVSRLRDTAILARTTPEQKLRIVRALQAAGEIVTVTGDGVNDAPALRIADVGIAMGRRGTEVAKQASDIVLLDENFATIVAAIEEGRAIKHNIRRFASYVFTSNVAELVPFLFYIFLPVPLPLTILQVLAIELGTDMLPALALGLEPPSPRALEVTPEPPRSPLLTRSLALRTFLFYGVIEAALSMAGFFAVFWAAGWRPFASLAPFEITAVAGSTLTFLGIVGGQIGCLFAQRDGSLRARLSLHRNPWIALGLAVELALALVLVYVPGVDALFSMAPVSPAWLLALPIGAAIMITADHLRRVLFERLGASSSEPRAGQSHHGHLVDRYVRP